VVEYVPDEKVVANVMKKIYLKIPGISPRHGVFEVMIEKNER
jgi:hypothetical protein